MDWGSAEPEWYLECGEQTHDTYRGEWFLVLESAEVTVTPIVLARHHIVLCRGH